MHFQQYQFRAASKIDANRDLLKLYLSINFHFSLRSEINSKAGLLIHIIPDHTLSFIYIAIIYLMVVSKSSFLSRAGYDGAFTVVKAKKNIKGSL